MKRMVDTIHATVHRIPTNYPKVAGYTTGTPDIRWTADDWARFPHSGKVPIDQSNSINPTLGPVKDVEPGASFISTMVDWVRGRQRRGWNSCVYCAEFLTGYSYGECMQALHNARVDMSKVQFGIANWNLSESQATTRLGGNIVWVQYASPTSNPRSLIPGTNVSLAAANADLSVTADHWFELADHHPHHEHHDARGEFRFVGHFDAATGLWKVDGTPNPSVTFDDNERWASVEVQVCVGGKRRGEWRTHPLPWNSPPLGGS